MGYQQNSIDIIHLQAIALDSHVAITDTSDSSRVRGLQKPTRSPLPPLHPRATSATNEVTRQSSRDDGNTAKSIQWNAIHRQNVEGVALRKAQAEPPSAAMSNAPMHPNSAPSQGDTQDAPDWVAYGEKEKSSARPSTSHINEDDTGFIDIVNGFVQDLSVEESTATGSDGKANENDDTMLMKMGREKTVGTEGENDGGENEDEHDEPVDLVSQDVGIDGIQVEPFPESRRFQQPVTPHVGGAKRKRSFEEATSQFTTPALPTNPFAGLSTSDMMRPSQIFNATQAQTSPLLVHSDTLSERPSPNINDFGRPSTAGSLSSPVVRRDPRLIIARAVTEPQGNYVSMKESQDARERRQKQSSVAEADPFDEEFEQQSHSQPLYGIEHRRNMGIASDFDTKKKTSHASLHQANKGGIAGSLRGQRLRDTGMQERPVVLTSDTAPIQDESGNVTEEETEREEEKEEEEQVLIYNDTDKLAEDNKENIEVPMTISRQRHGQVVISQSTPSRHRARNVLKKSKAQPSTQVVRSPRETSSPSREPLREGSQPFAVRDSQSSQQRDKNGLDAPVRHQSSLQSSKTIPQSQILEKSRSSIPQSSIPSKDAASKEIVDLVLSSPLRANESRRKILRGSSAAVCDSGDVKAQQCSRPADDAGLNAGESSACAEQGLSKTASQRKRKMKDQVAASMRSTIPETSSTATRHPLRATVSPDSSPSMASPRPPVSSASKPATNQSPSGQSLTTTLYETAQDNPNQSTSSHRNQDLPSIPSGRTASLERYRRRNFDEVTTDLSPPEAADDFGLTELMLSKDDEMFLDTIRGRSQHEANSRRPDDEKIDNPPPRRDHPVANNTKPRVVTSTKWKSFPSDHPLQDTGSPTRPTSSAISRLTERTPSEDGYSSSSSLTSPPSSDREERYSPVPPETTPVILDLRTEGSRDPLCSLLTAVEALDSGKQNHIHSSMRRHKPHPSSKSAHARRLPNEECQTSPRFSAGIPVVAPDRVFAHFNGKSSFFYTATCLGVIPGDEPRYSVRYDDGAEACINAYGIKRLEFRPGDVMKVDLPDCRNKYYVVVGMAEQQAIDEPKSLARLRKNNPDDTRAWPGTDIYGHSKVLLVPKQVQSVINEQQECEQIAVGMYDLYITQAMWTNIRDREFTYVDRKMKDLEGCHTPVDHLSAPSTPPSRMKRLKNAPMIQTSFVNSHKQGLFSNMVFTLTNIAQASELERTKSLIIAHGGKILGDGFGPLFHVPVLHRTTSPKKSDSDRDFHPTREAHGLGFTCLIADKHCRRAKYIQALALGIPCLATRWISDCVSKQRLLPWSAYLLPAGESAFLGGAAHSRVLPTSPAETVTLTKLLDQRPHMLKGSSILLIMSKNEQETMRQYPLLTFALSPARVARTLSIEAAAKAVTEAHAVGEPWDWVFSYDREHEVERLLFGSAAKKRKMRGGNVGGRGGDGLRTRVIGNEFVIQSLILGQLLEE